MKSRARSKSIVGLIAATLALLGSFPDTDPRLLSEGRDPLADALADEVESGDLDDVDVDDHQQLLERLALSPSRTLRARVAEAAGGLAGQERGLGLRLLRQLSHDTCSRVRAAAARGLGHWLEHAPAALRTSVESAWATAPASDERVALARALAQSTPDWLTDLAIGELTADGQARVRREALTAVQAQVERNPGVYVALAAARVSDPDRRVRKGARKALRRVHGSPLVGALHASPDAQRESRARYRRALRAETAVHAPAARPLTEA